MAPLSGANSSRGKEAPLEEVRWRAQWIWCQGEDRPKNFYLYVRKTLVLPTAAKSATLLISADSRYQLFVNGTFVARGPARCDRRWQYFDPWDIAPYLHEGKNALAALVHHYGETTFWYTLGRGGFLAQADIVCENQFKVLLQTDDTWKVQPSEAWERSLPRMSMQQGFPEIYDARRAPEGWTLVDFDDTQWQRPVLLGLPPMEPWPVMVARDIPAMQETPVFAERVLDVGQVGKAVRGYYVDLLKVMWSTDSSVAYVATHVWSPRDAEFEIHAGSDDAIKLWVNDALVIGHLVDRAAAPDQEIAKVRLSSGWNRVLAKIVQGRGMWAFYFRFEGQGSDSLVYAPYPMPLDQAGQYADRPWMIIGPFDSPDLKSGFDTIYPPEREVHYSKSYPGKGGIEVIWKSAGETREPELVSIILGRERRLPLGDLRVENREGLIQRDAPPAVIHGSGEHGVYILIDFGKEVAGFPRVKIQGAVGGEIIDLGYGEVLQRSDGEILSPASGEIGRLNPDREGVHYADRYLCKPGDQEFQTFDKRAFRYLQIDVRHLTKPLKVGPVSLVLSTYPVQYRGQFECSDPRLNEIWRVGRWTVQLNMEDAYTDCPWRERGQWWGDARIEALCNYYAFGDLKLIRKGLRQIAQSQNDEGLTWGVYPTDWPHGILPTFTLIWIYSLWDYYLFAGDKELVAELWPKVERALKFFERHLDEHHLLNELPYWCFVDWADVETRGEATAINCFYYRALTATSEMAEVLGHQTAKAQYRGLAERLRAAINSYLWDEDRGVYRDACIQGTPSAKISEQANALAILFDVAPQEQWSRILDYVLDPSHEVLRCGSPYFSFYLLGALYKAGRHAHALNYLRQRWGQMLDWGATTWWEMWQPYASFCHGWSAGPTHDLPAEFLGVKPTLPGWTEMIIKPHPVDLLWAKGVVPTVKGDVSVQWRKAASLFEMTVSIPAHVVAMVWIPFIEGSAGVAKVNGQTKKLPKGVRRLADEEGYARFVVRRAGKYQFATE